MRGRVLNDIVAEVLKFRYSRDLTESRLSSEHTTFENLIDEMIARGGPRSTAIEAMHCSALNLSQGIQILYP